jgi:hypothetical protein
MAEYVPFNKLEGVIAHRIRRAVCEPKPWSVAVFEREREHLTRFVRENICPLIENDVKRVLVRAPVKSGKREMVEYLAMRDKNTTKRRVHAFISSWHRTADSEQRDELETQNLSVFSIINDTQVDSFLQWLEVNLQQDNDIVIHLDECDHGSGEKQKLSKIWNRIRNDVQITTILYSATPEEVMFSEELDTVVDDFMESHPPILYTPPEGYCGPARFLEEGLVYDALPFFTKDGLSEQAKEIIGDMRESMLTDSSRNILILRLTYSLGGNKKDNKAIHVFLKNLSQYKELSDFFVIVDKPDKVIKSSHPILKQDIEWSSKNYWDFMTKDRPILIVHDQTATRSTEWSCHDRVFATHDYRDAVTFVTVSQAQERVNHYEQKYGGFQRIRAYGHKKSFQLSAGQIDYKEYIGNPWFMRKVDRRIATEVYTIRNTDTNTLHPNHNKHYTKNEAIEILRSLMSYGEADLSSRVVCGGSEVPVYEGEWIPITKETWETDWSKYRLTHPEFGKTNPFDEAEKHKKGEIWLGQHRGWKHLEFSEGKLYNIVSGARKQIDLGSTGGDRKTICYNNGQLGVFIAHLIGQRKTKPIRTKNSMFVSL